MTEKTNTQVLTYTEGLNLFRSLDGAFFQRINGDFTHYIWRTPQQRGVLYCHRVYYFAPSGTLYVKDRLWTETRYGKLMRGGYQINRFFVTHWRELHNLASTLKEIEYKPVWN